MKIVSFTNFFSATAAATTAAALTELGEHASGDWIFVCLVNGGGATLIEQNAGTTGWTDTGTQGAIESTRSTVFSKKAASSSETVPVFKGATDEWSGTVLVIRGLDATTAIAQWQRTDWTNVATGNSNGGGSGSTLAASSVAGPTAITYAANSMMLVFAASDTAPSLTSDIGVLTELTRIVDAGTLTHLIGYKLLQGSGTVPNIAIRSTVSARGGNIWTLVLTPTSTTDLIPFATSDVTALAYLGDIGAQHDQAITWEAPTTRQATIDSLATSAVALTRSTSTGSTTSPVGTLTTWAYAVDIAAEGWIGEIGTLTTPWDLTDEVITFQWQTNYTAATPAGSKGVGLYVEDSSGNWSWFSLRTRTRFIGALYTSVIDPATATRQDGSGTLDVSSIKYFGLLVHRVPGSASSRNVQAKFFLSVGKTTLIGGGTSDPAGWQAIADCLSSWGALNIGKVHSASSDQFQIKTDIDIGDGANAVIASIASTSCAYPGAWNANSFEMPDWNTGVDSRTIRLVGGGSSTIDLSASLFSSDAYQQANFDIPNTFAGTITANGLTLGGFTLTDSEGVGWSGVTFKGGGTVTIDGGGDLTNCTISNTTSTNAALAITANGTVLDGCTIDGTGAAYALELGTAVTAITLTDCTLTAGSLTPFDKIHVLATTGTVTITISGTTSLVAGDVTSAGATVVIAAPQPTLDATVLSGTRVVLYNNTTAAELDNTAPAGTSWSKVITSGASANDNMTLFAFKEGYAEFSTSFLYSGEDTTILVTQVVDDVVAAFRTEDSITDYTTLTEYNIYAPTIYIQADDADGVSKISRLATYYNGVLTTEDGARYFRGGMSMLSTGAVRVNKSVIELLLENVSATKSLRFSDEATRRLYTDDGTTIIAPSSVAGSIEYAYGGVPDVVAVGSAVLQSDIDEIAAASGTSAATAVLAAAAVTPIHADAKKMNGATINGTGIDSDLWRGA